MSAAELQRLKQIFHAAQELPPNERPAFLNAACGDDTELRREADALLKSNQAANGFMEDPPAQLAAEVFGDAEIPTAIGRTIGRYKLVERIGSGGMGEVYLAERADQQFEMQVAIKLIKRGMDTDQVLRRFQHERQILASLEHPNIARLLDGGTTEDGLPYFVMEYIQGERIDRYVDEKRLSLRERLELFRQICGAVSYAHQHLVVHRDLKPSNILVTASGVPKLLDFGIAKITQADDDAGALATLTVAPILTPEYASPEQIEGAHATTQSDVYSLGVVLYALLTGSKPYRTRTKRPEEMAQAIREQEPTRPSENRESKNENRKSLRGDLDNIVLMALRKEAARRYRSVEQFSEDIRRHLAGRPVIARRDTWSYRSAKFVRRNKLALSAAALVLLSLIAGICATTWQAQKARRLAQVATREKARAERRFNDVRKLANNVLFDYHDAIKDLPGATKVRERLVKDALSYLDSLAGEAQGDPALQRELAAAYERVGDVRGGASSGSLGDIAGALQSYTKAFTIREALVAVNSDDAQAQRDLARSHQKIGYRMLDTGEAGKGLERLHEALTLYRSLTRQQSADTDLQLELIDTYNKLGEALNLRGDLVGALEHLRAALSVGDGAGPSHQHDQKLRRLLWTTHEHIAEVLSLDGDAAAAIAANQKALVLGETLISDDPLNIDYRRGLVLNYRNGGHYRMRTDKPGALEYFRKAATLNEELLARDPANAVTRKDLGQLHKRIAEFVADLEDNSEALLHFNKALAIFEKVVADAPADLQAQFFVVSCGAGVAAMHARLGEMERALRGCREAIALLDEIAEDPANAFHRQLRAQSYEFLGFAYDAIAKSSKDTASESRQHTSAARDMFQKSLNVLNDLRDRGLTSAGDETWFKMIAAEIAKCDTALREP